MEKLGCSLLKKGKKKHVKDEIDRQKQAEKKRRRLEKALATSAAICSELEKKKQKKKEEQQRLDEEGAAIAEAVALNVLVGEDIDIDESHHHFMLNNNARYSNPWEEDSGNIGLFMGYQNFGWPTGSRYSPGLEIGQSLPPRVYVRDLRSPYNYEENYRGADISAELIAARAVASLQIAEDSQEDPFVIDRMLGGNSAGDGLGFYREF